MDKLGQEILNIKTDAEQYAVRQTKELLKVYKRNLDDIQNQIARIYMKYSVDGALNISTKQRYSVLLQLEQQLAEQMQVLGETNVKITTDILTEVYSDSYYKTAYTIEKGVSVAGSFAMLKPEFVQAAISRPIKGKDFSKRIWDNTNKLVNRVKSDIEKALIQGQSVEKLARQIKNDFGSSAYAAKRLISNETARTVSLAQEEIYSSSGIDGLKIMWDATLDNKTSEECAALDGKTWDINEEHPTVPNHILCRCCLLPIVPNHMPTKKRENIVDPMTGDKKVIDYMPYNQWNTYTKAKQYEPIITKDLKDIVSKLDSSLEGLESKIKTEKSFSRKVKTDMLSGKSEQEVLNSTYDIVRYTNVTTPEKLKENYTDVVDILSKKGYNIIRVKNTLSDSNAPYRGINTIVSNSDGFKFELQFHTLQSYEIKEKSHKLYEKLREQGISTKEKANISKQMMELSSKIKVPEEISKIKSFDNIKKEDN